MTLHVAYKKGADLPDMPVTWRDYNRALIPFAAGYTWTLRLALRNDPDVILLTKTAGFTGSDSRPNLLVVWAASGELNSLALGRYEGEIEAFRTADGRSRYLPFFLDLGRRIGPQT